MKILAFDTSSSACSIALSMDGKVTSSHEIAPMQQAKIILFRIKSLLEQENTQISELDAIAFGCGPGSFTGVRIAISVAQGLAYAAQKPLIAISSLAATAQTAWMATGWRTLCVAIDARMNEAYWGSYQIDNNNRAVLAGQERITPPADIILPGSEWCGVGNAWDVYKDFIPVRPKLIETSVLPNASAVLLLAESKLKAGETVLPGDALPVYLRDDVAKK